jgi:hypothetical protein
VTPWRPSAPLRLARAGSSTTSESGAKGDVHIWLKPHVVNQLRRLRGSGESFSDVIMAAQD